MTAEKFTDLADRSPQELAALLTQIAALLTEKLVAERTGKVVPQRLLTVEETARRLGVSTSWIYRKARAGRLPFVRRQGRRTLRFSEQALDEYIATGSRGSP